MDSGIGIGGHFVGHGEYHILRHINLLKGHFSEYIEHASDHVIDQIQNCCNAYLRGFFKCKMSEIRGIGILTKLVRKDMLKICDSDLSQK